MIVWRGFGAAAFILGLLGVVAGFGLSNAVNDGVVSGPLVGAGLLAAGIVTFVLGWWLNVLNPKNKTQRWVEQRRAELSLQPGAPAGGLDPQVQAGIEADTEAAQVSKQLRNNHTLFWIPMQWWGVVWALLSILLFANVIQAA